ncbi:MAG: glutamate racemase [Bacteroidota bacterium]
MSTSPIGIFDSGIGGTSIWKALNTLLPGESTLYLADSKHAPYGTKSKDEITAFSIKNTELLIAKGCKLVVVACNTATTNAIDYLREHYSIPFIGIEPAIKPAAIQTQTKVIGILATKGTLSSILFHKTSDLYAEGIAVIEQVGEGLVSLIEEGNIKGKAVKALLKTYLLPMMAKNIDHLVLGCTHYPYLIPEMRKLLPPSIKIIDSGAAVARQTKVVLGKNKLLNTSDSRGTHHFYSNLDEKILIDFLSEIGVEVHIKYLDF